MKKATFSNIDRAILETPTNLRNPSREYLQKMLEKYLPENRKRWEKKLEWAKNYEKSLIRYHKTDQDCILMDMGMQKYYPEHNNPEICANTLRLYLSAIDSLFHQMHLVAYVEGLVNTANPEIVDEETR